MLHIEESEVKKRLLKGHFGLEKENLRVDEEGFLVHTSHPFPGNEHIVRDFCENQVEVNTPVMDSLEAAVACLKQYEEDVKNTLQTLPAKEYLWPFSNPPYIKNEEDIPVAAFVGEDAEKTTYREYLSDRYGRYKMTFCGIHVNYSFDEELLKKTLHFLVKKIIKHIKIGFMWSWHKKQLPMAGFLLQ